MNTDWRKLFLCASVYVGKAWFIIQRTQLVSIDRYGPTETIGIERVWFRPTLQRTQNTVIYFEVRRPQVTFLVSFSRPSVIIRAAICEMHRAIRVTRPLVELIVCLLLTCGTCSDTNNFIPYISKHIYLVFSLAHASPKSTEAFNQCVNLTSRRRTGETYHDHCWWVFFVSLWQSHKQVR